MLAAVAQGCTNSKWVISPLYNRLDDRIRDEFNKLGNYSDQQTAAFEASLGTYHVWHRQSELPQYAELLTELAGSIARFDTSAANIEQWMTTAEKHSLLARECHPINFSFELMKSLTDEQLTFMENRFRKQQKKNREKYKNRTAEERVERRVKNVAKWAGRIDVDITPTQRAMLLSTFKRQVSMRNEYYELSADWNKQFFILARSQDNPDYDQDMRDHLNRLWHLLEDAYPEQWQANRDLWEETGLRFAQSMTEKQRQTITTWLTKMASTLVEISKDEPSFKVVNDPSIGCLVNPEKT